MQRENADREAVLSLRDVCVNPDEHNAVIPLNNINLDVYKGELLCIIGGERSGKSSLLSVMGGRHLPDSGTVIMAGSDLKHPCFDVPVILNPPMLMPWVDLETLFNVALKLRQAFDDEGRALRDKYIELMELEDFTHKKMYELTDDMKFRASFVQAMMCDPKVIIMDDPFFHFEPMTRITLQCKMREVSKHSDAAIVFGTRSLDEAIRVGSRIIVMGKEGGRIVDELNLDRTTSSDEIMEIGKRIYKYYYSSDIIN